MSNDPNQEVHHGAPGEIPGRGETASGAGETNHEGGEAPVPRKAAPPPGTTKRDTLAGRVEAAIHISGAQLTEENVSLRALTCPRCREPQPSGSWTTRHCSRCGEVWRPGAPGTSNASHEGEIEIILKTFDARIVGPEAHLYSIHVAQGFTKLDTYKREVVSLNKAVGALQATHVEKDFTIAELRRQTELRTGSGWNEAIRAAVGACNRIADEGRRLPGAITASRTIAADDCGNAINALRTDCATPCAPAAREAGARDAVRLRMLDHPMDRLEDEMAALDVAQHDEVVRLTVSRTASPGQVAVAPLLAIVDELDGVAARKASLDSVYKSVTGEDTPNACVAHGQTRASTDGLEGVHVFGAYGFGSGGTLYSVSFPHDVTRPVEGMSEQDILAKYPVIVDALPSATPSSSPAGPPLWGCTTPVRCGWCAACQEVGRR